MQVVATGLNKPRGIIFDTKGNLLVVEQGKGLTSLTLKDEGGACLSVADTNTVIDESSVSYSTAQFKASNVTADLTVVLC